MKPGRNEPCPCGSGSKVKRCCGVDGAARREEATAELLALALHFPRYRPASPGFERWAFRAPEAPTQEAVEEGIAAMGAAERRRIVGGFRREYPPLWEGVVRDFGDDELASQIVLVGAVVTGVDERRRPLDPAAVAVLEHAAELRDRPVESLASVLDPQDLWSVVETGLADAAFDAGRSVAEIAAGLVTDWHEERVRLLLERVSGALPLDGHPGASRALMTATKTLAAEPVLRRRLCEELLLDSLPSVHGLVSAA